MSERPTRTEGEPHDRMTRLCDVAMKAIEASPEAGDLERLRLIVFLRDDARSGIGRAGYDDDAEALTDLFMSLRAMFRAAGKELTFLPVEPGSG